MYLLKMSSVNLLIMIIPVKITVLIKNRVLNNNTNPLLFLKDYLLQYHTHLHPVH